MARSASMCVLIASAVHTHWHGAARAPNPTGAMLTTPAAQNEEKAPGCMAGCQDGCKAIVTCWKPLLYAQPWIALAPIVAAPKKVTPMVYTPRAGRFVVAFCGSGTGHMTQTLAVTQLLKARGMELAGIVLDVR